MPERRFQVRLKWVPTNVGTRNDIWQIIKIQSESQTIFFGPIRELSSLSGLHTVEISLLHERDEVVLENTLFACTYGWVSPTKLVPKL